METDLPSCIYEFARRVDEEYTDLPLSPWTSGMQLLKSSPKPQVHLRFCLSSSTVNKSSHSGRLESLSHFSHLQRVNSVTSYIFLLPPLFISLRYSISKVML